MAADEIARLRDRVAELEEENRQLREALAPAELIVSPLDGVHMPRQMAILFACLRKRGVASKRQLCTAAFGVGGGQDPKGIHVYIYKLRQVVEPLGFRIETVWGQGYRLIEPASAELVA